MAPTLIHSAGNARFVSVSREIKPQEAALSRWECQELRQTKLGVKRLRLDLSRLDSCYVFRTNLLRL